MSEDSKIKSIKEVAELLKGDLAARVETDKLEILEGLMVLAKGVSVITEVFTDKGIEKQRVYSKLPDKEVAMYLLNTFIGKPKQNVEVSGDPDKPLVIQVAPEIAAKYNLTPQSDATPSTEDNSSGQS